MEAKERKPNNKSGMKAKLQVLTFVTKWTVLTFFHVKSKTSALFLRVQRFCNSKSFANINVLLATLSGSYFRNEGKWEQSRKISKPWFFAFNPHFTFQSGGFFFLCLNNTQASIDLHREALDRPWHASTWIFNVLWGLQWWDIISVGTLCNHCK